MKTTTRGISSGQMWKSLLRTLLLLSVLCLAAGMPNVQAQTVRTSVSHGNLIYESKRGSAALYAADIHLLEEKISTIPERCFDPADYAAPLIYEAVNEADHSDRYASNTTLYCQGCEEPEPPDTSWAEEAGEEPDEADKPGTEDAPEEAETPDPPETEDAPEEPETPDPSGKEDVPEEPETPDPSGKEDVPEEPGSEESPEDSDEPGSENPPEDSGEPGSENPPEDSDEPEYEDAPGTGDAPESPDPPDTGDVPVATLKYGLIHNNFVKRQKEDFEFYEKI